MSDDPRSHGTDPNEPDSPFPWMQGDLDEEIAPPFRPWMIAVAVASMVIFVVAVWYAWSEGQSTSDAPPPVIRADDSPVKITPEEPGGMDVPHQENEVFAAIEDMPEEPVEELLPPPEEPVMRPEPAPRAVEPETAPEPQAEAAGAEAPEPEADTPVDEPEPAQTAEATPPPPPAPAPQPAPATEATPSGNFVIQLAALQSRAAADDAWQRLLKTHTRLLAELSLDVEAVNVPDRGMFYRIRGAAFPTRDAAQARCDQLKAAGQACLVKPR